MSDDGINGNAEYDPPSPHKKMKATYQVTELKHKTATGFHAQSASGVNGVGDFLQKKVVFDMECWCEEHLEWEGKLKEEKSSRQT